MYITVELQTNNAGVVSNIVTSFDTLAAAESHYYSILAAAAVSVVPVHSAILISSDSFPIRNQCYKHNG